MSRNSQIGAYVYPVVTYEFTNRRREQIMFHPADEAFVWVGRAPVANWLSYQAERGQYNVEIEADPRSPSRPYGKPVTRRRSARCATGWRGRPGWRSGARTRNYDRVHDAVLEAGQEFGMEPCGSRAYASNTLESGWIPSPLPAIYTGDELRAYREWLGVDSYEATNSLASYVSDEIEDYHLNPWELGYGPFVKFDHDFVGRDTLGQIDPETQRRKVTLAWDGEEVAKIHASFSEPDGEEPYMFFDVPIADYGSSNFDSVIDADGNRGGLLDVQRLQRQRAARPVTGDRRPCVEIGTEVRVVWGEPGGGSCKATVQPHRQINVRAVVRPVPYAVTARPEYAEGWRTAGRS